VDLDAINATVREVLTEAATIGSTAAQVLGAVQDIAIDATPLMELEARAAAIVGRISAELQGFQSIMSPGGVRLRRAGVPWPPAGAGDHRGVSG
jgi:hypothetical protein